MKRETYQTRARELARRGENAPSAKLSQDDVESILSAKRQRESLRTYVKDNLSNEALAKKYGVSSRAIEKIMSNQSWVHVS